jgi:hypothetical protein
MGERVSSRVPGPRLDVHYNFILVTTVSGDLL